MIPKTLRTPKTPRTLTFQFSKFSKTLRLLGLRGLQASNFQNSKILGSNLEPRESWESLEPWKIFFSDFDNIKF